MTQKMEKTRGNNMKFKRLSKSYPSFDTPTTDQNFLNISKFLSL